MKGNRRSYTLLAMVLIAGLLAPAELWADDQEPKEDDSRFRSNIRMLVFGDIQDPAASTQNPGNAFLQLYRYSGEIDLRPDLFYDGDAVSVIFKPRFITSYRWWEDGVMSGQRDGLTRAFVNEWRLQAAPSASLFVSFGKEKLLWGPSFLASPSNILFKDTERTNPKAEVEGKYFARVLVLPDQSFTITVLAETQKDEELPAGNNDPMRALKADWVGSTASASVIGYYRRGDRLRIGSYGQWTASDAVLFYYDGIVTRGTDVLYPGQDPANPLGGTFARSNDSTHKLYPTVTAGSSYTFQGGSTASFEFLYNRPGYTDAEAEDYYALRRNAANHFFDSGAMSGLPQRTLAQAFDTGMPLLRKYYLMGQYQVQEIANKVDVIVRYVHSIEERAGQASTIVEWKLTDRTEFFNVNSLAVGGSESSFGSVLRGSFMAGVEIHF